MIGDRRRREHRLRRVSLASLLIMFDVLMVFSSLSITNHVFALSGTGVGIRKDGPEHALIGDVVLYTITAYNLGDYWIRNVTVIDRFPDGTSVFWKIRDLAPSGQPGDYFEIKAIHYNIHSWDVLPGNPPYIINHAEVSGYSDTESVSVLVRAETNYPTSIENPTVGGYSISIKATLSSTPTTIYITLLSIMTAAFSKFTQRTARARVVCKKHRKSAL